MTINGDTADGEPCMFVKGMYLSVFYCLCYDTDIYTDISEDQVAEERDLDLNEKEDIRFDKIWEDNWRDIDEENYDKKNIHALRWDVYVKEKEERITRDFSLFFPHPKGGAIVWTCVKDKVIDEKDDYKEIGLNGLRSVPLIYLLYGEISVKGEDLDLK